MADKQNVAKANRYDFMDVNPYDNRKMRKLAKLIHSRSRVWRHAKENGAILRIAERGLVGQKPKAFVERLLELAQSA
ncbi:MAG: hypothetical protein QM775_06635 [Pirellulales bacterium]